MATPEAARVGIIGCGNISSAYINGCRAFDWLRVAGVADLRPEVAQAKAAEHDLACAGSVEALLADPDIDIVINLTVPNVHAAVSLAILAAGKHVYSEKPLAVERADGRAVLAAAATQGLRVGCAPDTFLGGGLQTCRRLIDAGPSASRWRPWPSCSATGRRAGIPTPVSSTTRARGRCLIWGRIT